MDLRNDTPAVAVIDDGEAIRAHCQIANEATGSEQLATIMLVAGPTEPTWSVLPRPGHDSRFLEVINGGASTTFA